MSASEKDRNLNWSQWRWDADDKVGDDDDDDDDDDVGLLWVVNGAERLFKDAIHNWDDRRMRLKLAEVMWPTPCRMISSTWSLGRGCRAQSGGQASSVMTCHWYSTKSLQKQHSTHRVSYQSMLSGEGARGVVRKLGVLKRKKERSLAHTCVSDPRFHQFLLERCGCELWSKIYEATVETQDAQKVHHSDSSARCIHSPLIMLQQPPVK